MANSVGQKKIFGAILAGGSGKRMKISELPKQFLILEDKPILIHTIEKFLLVEEFQAICVGINSQWKRYFEDLLKKHFNDEAIERINVVPGGENRSQTIEYIIEYLESNYQVGTEDILVTHDAVRPFVSLRIIAENIEMSEKYAMIDTVIPAHDTIVVSDDGERVKEIPLRSNMYLGQTPQTFNIKAYSEYYNQLNEEEKQMLTDACKVFILKDDPVGMVRGDEANIKITTVKDLKLARALLGEKND